MHDLDTVSSDHTFHFCYILYFFFQGEAGVRKVLDILKDEFSLAMALAGNNPFF